MKELLARAMKVAEAADVFTFTSDETPLQFETNRLKHIQSKQSTSVALRIIKEGHIGYASIYGARDVQILVDMAVESARFGMEAKFKLPYLGGYPKIDVFDPGVESVPIEIMSELGEKLIADVRSVSPDIICNGGVEKSTISVRILNSTGGEANFKKSYFSLGIEGTLINGTDMLFVGDSANSCHPILDTKEISEKVRWQLQMAKNVTPVSGGSLPVIFTPDGLASAFIPSLMAAFNGKTVLEGASPLANRLGQNVFDEKISLWDDPTIPFQPGSRICDDEGVPSQKTSLIESGTVSHFLYDLQTAARANTASTGNGSRNQGVLSPSPSAFVIATGNVTFDNMVRDIKEGLVVEWLMGAEQGNVLGGDFSGNVLLGYKVENGKIVGRVKNAMVSGNIYQVLKEVTAVGSEAKWVGGFLNTPHIYCPSLSVTAK